MEVVVAAVKTTVPVKLFSEPRVIVTGGIVPPAATDTVGVAEVIVKSGQVPEETVTINGVVTTEPFETAAPPVPPASPAASTGPFEPA